MITTKQGGGTCIATRTHQPNQKSKEARAPFDVRALLVLWLERKSLRSFKAFFTFRAEFRSSAKWRDTFSAGRLL